MPTTTKRTLTVRSLDESMYDALKARAASHHRSMEAEARHILTDAVLPAPRTLADLAAQLPPVDSVPFVRSSERPSEADSW